MGNITRNFANLITADGTSGIPDGTVTNADLAGSISTDKLAGNINFKNIIINGDMSIAQRGTSESGITSNGYYTADRMNIMNNFPSAVFTVSQSTDVPTGQGFSKSMKFDCTTADASPATGFLGVQQIIEGQNLQYLKKGTANAESTTLSFWIKSNKTGTYICELFDNDNNRTISQSYTISSASTWEKKTLTFVGDTSGALDNNNGASLYVSILFGAGTEYTSGSLQTAWGTRSNTKRAVGQVNLADSTANELYITGVQLEAGTTASDFEFLPVDVNLRRCQRYYYKFAGQPGQTYMNFGMSATNGTSSIIFVYFPVPLRDAATISSSGTFSSNVPYGGAAYENITSGPSLGDQGPTFCRLDYGTTTSYSAGLNGRLLVLNQSPANAFIDFDAEL